MNLKVNRTDLIDGVIVTLSLAYVLVLIWAHVLVDKISLNLLIMMAISLITGNTKIKIKNIDVIAIMLLIVSAVLFSVNILMNSGIHEHKNVGKILSSALILIYYSNLVNHKMCFVKKYLAAALPAINIYYILNILLMLIQTRGTYFLMDTQTNGNTFYLDMITGFIGADGTHCVAIFTVFVIILNLCNIENYSHNVKRYAQIYLVVSTAVSLFVATQNDNNALFILVPVALIVYFIARTKIDLYNFLTKFWKLIAIVVVLIIGLHFLSTSTNEKFAAIAYRLNLTITSYSLTGGQILSTDERFRLYTLALQNGGMWGKGWGSIQMFSDTSINHHFGMSAIQPMIYMGGWVFYLIYNLTTAKLFAGKENGSIKRTILFFFLFVLMSYFTQIYIIDRLTYFMCFLCMVIRLVFESETFNSREVKFETTYCKQP